MPRPGVEIIARDQAPPPSGPPTDTSVFFAVGDTAIGPTVPTLIRSLSSYETTFGDRSGGTLLYDSVEAFFREGGTRVYISAVPVTPTTLVALSQDEYDELAAGTRAEIDKAATELGVEDPGSLPNKEAVLAAIREASANAPTTRAATPTQLIDALNKFDKGLGPGQVAIPGTVDTATQAEILDHAEACNRVALLDTVDAPPDAATLVQQATALHTYPTARYGGLFGPWAVLPGIAAGTTRKVPYSAVEAGIMARNDRVFTANEAAAGNRGHAEGLSLAAIDVRERYTDAEYEQLNDAGVNMARMIYGGVVTYGYVTLVDRVTDQLHLSLGNARLYMAIKAQAEAIGERYVFAQLDGRRRTIAQFGGELAAMLIPFWEKDALFGATAGEAFQVDVGDQVNTEETMAAGELHAVMKVKMSPFDELVVIEIVKVAVTEAIAA
jgi:hypothetical protein